jgi:inorganic pyrophosphatase
MDGCIKNMSQFNKLSPGDEPPNIVNVVIEIPTGSSIKYEMDKESGAVFVDRFLYTATHYPFNYGFIPQTREADGDPIDVIVLSQQPVYPMSVIRSRPVGMLLTEDEKGSDVKIVAAPSRKIDPYYASIETVDQLPDFTKQQIEHFFKEYKDLEPKKFVKIIGWEGPEAAKKKILKAIDLYHEIAKTL